MQELVTWYLDNVLVMPEIEPFYQFFRVEVFFVFFSLFTSAAFLGFFGIISALLHFKGGRE